MAQCKDVRWHPHPSSLAPLRVREGEDASVLHHSPPAPLTSERGARAIARIDAVSGRTLAILPFAVFLVALLVRLIEFGQPLVENYIDRQVHTAMMARNLARGDSALYPEVDIGPFPAYYMLEFPAYPWLAAGIASVSGLPLDQAGRLLSALAMAATCLLLFDLVRRYDGLTAALVAAAAMAAMPVTIRYGRAFQPDSLMLTSLVIAIWSMDRWSQRGGYGYLALTTLATGVALLLKVICAYLLVPIAYLAWRRYGWSFLRRAELWIALAIATIPAIGWYFHAWNVAVQSETVSTLFWQTHKWISMDRLADAATYRQLAYFVGIRVLTPVGLLLAILGAVMRRGFSGEMPALPRSATMLFHVWLVALAAYFPVLARKADHEHYYLAIAPVAAVFIGRALVGIARAPLGRWCYVNGPATCASLAVALLVCNAAACRSTFRSPAEWRHVTNAADAARKLTPRQSLVAAHSSVLFYADRRGFTFAYGPDEIEYLFRTWGEQGQETTPENLLEFYRRQGAEYFVELLGTNRERDNAAFFAHVRSRYELVHEEPGKFLVVALNSAGPNTALDRSNEAVVVGAAADGGS